eukprot:m.73263 g.73263  ORF g.73263 m.73263 type:complete len:69 (-) comp14320_c0_seq2:983-1189(-)
MVCMSGSLLDPLIVDQSPFNQYKSYCSSKACHKEKRRVVLPQAHNAMPDVQTAPAATRYNRPLAHTQS